MPGATIIVFLVLIGIAALASQVGKRRKGSYLFAGCPLMSDSEIRFFRVLQMAAPNELVFPQVGMAAIVRPKYLEGDYRFIAAFRKMSQKRIDFVVCKRDSLEVRCLVELDDSSHDALRDQLRDAITAKAGYRTVRVRAARRYDIDGLRRRVLDIPAEQVRLAR
jgi:very-short-patch-repair endonuclease